VPCREGREDRRASRKPGRLVGYSQRSQPQLSSDPDYGCKSDDVGPAFRGGFADGTLLTEILLLTTTLVEQSSLRLPSQPK